MSKEDPPNYSANYINVPAEINNPPPEQSPSRIILNSNPQQLNWLNINLKNFLIQNNKHNF